jgi:hypothetical protein
MAEFPVKYRLYDSTGTSLIYTFTYVQGDNSPQDPKDYVEISGLRGVGSVIIGGSLQPWDLQLRFLLQGADYEELITKIDALETTILFNTPYVLKIDRTQSTTKNYNVKRLTPFVFAEDFRVDFQEVIVNFRVNAW